MTEPRCGNDPRAQLTEGDRQAVESFKARLALQAAAKPYIDRAMWTDGDPLMEVIAVTLWERCARDDQEMPQAVCDDPRTIAAFAAAVVQASTEMRTPADWDALVRDADRLRHDGEALHARAEELDEQLAALRRQVSEPADRAAVLREAAQHLYTALFPAVYNDLGQKAAEGVNRAVSELRRMADQAEAELRRVADETAATETQAAEPVYLSTPCATCTHPYNWHCGQPACQFGREEALCGCRSFTPGDEPAAGARQDGAQP